MTLIAAFLSHETPAIVGDYLLTVENAKSGLRKKIMILGKNVAIAWTGHLSAANSVIKNLQSKLPYSEISMGKISVVLKDPETIVFEESDSFVTVIGWVVEANQRYCFRWSSEDPTEITYGDPIYEGSGAEEIFQIAGPRGLTNSQNINDKFSVKRGILTVLTNLLRLELVGPSTENSGYGFAYEAIIFDNKVGFHYLDNILYLSIIYRLDEKGKYLGFEGNPKKYKQISVGNISIVQIVNSEKEHNCFHIIHPAGNKENESSDDILRELKDKTEKISLEADFYCIASILIVPNFLCPKIIEVYPKPSKDSNGPITLNGNQIDLVINPGYVEAMYLQIKADQENKFSPK
ncbi:MAG: hypothetical protein JWP91_583 [Fibrobacteres bacterium]|nr:hypothetical protein [Fibrobacterota bacterium]